ncbi:transcriptional regulator GcvA [Pseudoxanthomonas putridarboris]|uniref:Transcriptional regulator GcvA n=1 Tax=Pseudoxanthomonas putridarboris TaxID=752605 RepID=A0ABU9IVI3_9GAMM
MKPRHPVPLNALRAFEAAARCLSFQAAAEQLFVTPAAVSHQVKRLEAYLGVKLFHRGHRAVELTAEGEALAASLGELFGLLDLALDRATAPTAADLRVSTMESFAAKWLAPRLHRFHRDCPDLKVRIETGNEHADFVRDGIDVAIRYGRGGYTGVSAERLMDAPVFPVCAPALPGDGRWPLAVPDDLRHHTLLHDESAAGRPGVPDWPAWLEAAGATRVDAAHGPVFASIYLAQEAAAAGHGVALGVAPLVEEDLHRGRLVKPFDDALDNAYAFWIVRRHGADNSPAVDAFCRWLRKEASGEAMSP